MSSQPRDLIEAPVAKQALAAAAPPRAADCGASPSTPSAASALRLLEQGADRDPLFCVFMESVRDCSIVLLDLEGLVTSWNPGAQRLQGYEPDDVVGKHVSVLSPEAERTCRESWQRELARAARTGRCEGQRAQGRKDGSRFWARVVLEPVRDGAGALVGFAKVTCALSEPRRAEEPQRLDERRVEEQRFGLLLDSVKDYALITLDPSGHIVTWNAGAELIKGYKAGEIIGSHFSRFYPEEDVRAGKCERELVLASREGRFEDEGWRVCKDGSRFWANVVISAIRDDRGELVGFSKVTRDLTERRRSEEERAARRAAEQANQTKDEFLAMLGHELRNPLAPIVSALQLLKLRDDGRFAREHQIIERQVKQMTRLVEDLLDVSRISRGKIELKRELVDLRELLARAVEIALPLLERKGHRFEVRVPEGALVVSGDDARLIQVFANLLNNAAKYTDDGGQILLAVEAGEHELEIEIRDNGAGIDPALLPRVFELFVQGYQDVDRAEGGLGLGLTLVKSLVLLHDGSVEVRSGGEARGSRFFVRLPRAEPPAAAAPKRAVRPPSALRRKILVVDDNEDARVLLAELLTKSGHEVETAEDGLTALQVLEEFHPDVAILDIGLPGMDGCELARRIRQLPAQAAVRLLALTGYGQAVDRLNTRAAGFDVHLVKPLDLQGLLGHLR